MGLKERRRIPIEKENRTYEIAGLKVNFDIPLQRFARKIFSPSKLVTPLANSFQMFGRHERFYNLQTFASGYFSHSQIIKEFASFNFEPWIVVCKTFIIILNNLWPTGAYMTSTEHENETYTTGSYMAHITPFGNYYRDNNNNSINLLCFFNCFQSDFLLKLVPLSNCLLVSWHWCRLDLKARSFPLRFPLQFEGIKKKGHSCKEQQRSLCDKKQWTGCFSTTMEEWNTNDSF